ncbi:uncharacterized protein [Blastocystis hominis]|uniref:Endoplasmic reticulum vesicle transporter C-terminal domain-containing protein n=1 Tax=Blastocystis hominis TaxID=12968 RepID=D8M3E4_BLAHO|nr:uncharacterized protein [Blastocystis hominis]CBK22417.2 unnamed protein product [Blastocystis hominis]|eukprot:XP_012896465.1 uncharacterized protein [Blastocystis hominis]
MKLDVDVNGVVTGFNRESISSSSSSSSSSDSCGSCYGAGAEGQCCNTCSAIVEAYNSRGWSPHFVLQFSPLCRNSRPSVLSFKSGCMIWGAIDVHQVAGDIHIQTTTGMIDILGAPVYDAEIISKLKSSHFIEHFSFGKHIPGVENPLNGRRFLANQLTSHAYQIEILPAIYERGGVEIRSNEISVYETDKVVTVEPSGTADVEPGLFFKYRISPFEHVIREDRKEFWSLVVRLCGVMGGMMAVGGKGRRE